VLRFADRCFIFLTRSGPQSMALRVRARGQQAPEDLKALAAELTRALNRVVRRNGTRESRVGLPVLRQRGAADVDALVRELEAADPATIGLGYQPERGPGHEGLRVLNIRGTGACNSDCIFCVEKFDPAHRTMPKADATRQFILDNAGQFDMLFFASGEPTIHPKLFEYVELARTVGFTSFGMSSHFRTFADPVFALRVLQAGFEYFDISLHAAEIEGQLAVNPIDDGGASLHEALKGLAVLYALAEAFGMRISVTHKIVASRLNVTALDAIFHATYDRGVRHFIVQPVRAMNLDPERKALLAIDESEILPYLNAFLARTEGLGATVKPYGFSRQHLLAAAHVGDGAESRQERGTAGCAAERCNAARPWRRRRSGRATAATGSKCGCPKPAIVSSSHPPASSRCSTRRSNAGTRCPSAAAWARAACAARVCSKGRSTRAVSSSSPRRSSATATCCSVRRGRRAISSSGCVPRTSWTPSDRSAAACVDHSLSGGSRRSSCSTSRCFALLFVARFVLMGVLVVWMDQECHLGGIAVDVLAHGIRFPLAAYAPNEYDNGTFLQSLLVAIGFATIGRHLLVLRLVTHAIVSAGALAALYLLLRCLRELGLDGRRARWVGTTMLLVALALAPPLVTMMSTYGVGNHPEGTAIDDVLLAIFAAGVLRRTLARTVLAWALVGFALYANKGTLLVLPVLGVAELAAAGGRAWRLAAALAGLALGAMPELVVVATRAGRGWGAIFAKADRGAGGFPQNMLRSLDLAADHRPELLVAWALALAIGMVLAWRARSRTLALVVGFACLHLAALGVMARDFMDFYVLYGYPTIGVLLAAAVVVATEWAIARAPRLAAVVVTCALVLVVVLHRPATGEREHRHGAPAVERSRGRGVLVALRRRIRSRVRPTRRAARPDPRGTCIGALPIAVRSRSGARVRRRDGARALVAPRRARARHAARCIDGCRASRLRLPLRDAPIRRRPRLRRLRRSRARRRVPGSGAQRLSAVRGCADPLAYAPSDWSSVVRDRGAADRRVLGGGPARLPHAAPRCGSRRAADHQPRRARSVPSDLRRVLPGCALIAHTRPWRLHSRLARPSSCSSLAPAR
jgi:hypothetical protein